MTTQYDWATLQTQVLYLGNSLSAVRQVHGEAGGGGRGRVEKLGKVSATSDHPGSSLKEHFTRNILCFRSPPLRVSRTPPTFLHSFIQLNIQARETGNLLQVKQLLKSIYKFIFFLQPEFHDPEDDGSFFAQMVKGNEEFFQERVGVDNVSCQDVVKIVGRPGEILI